MGIYVYVFGLIRLFGFCVESGGWDGWMDGMGGSSVVFTTAFEPLSGCLFACLLGCLRACLLVSYLLVPFPTESARAYLYLLPVPPSSLPPFSLLPPFFLRTEGNLIW